MNILTFDIEEWFHILDHESVNNISEWDNHEIRIHKNLDRILELTNNNNLNATFFIVGWIAKKYPEIVKKISEQGHEIASHTHFHQLLYRQSREEIKEDLETSISTLEDLTGKKVIGFRAPGFSITLENIWVFDILIEKGIQYDSSIFPGKRAHGGLKEFSSNRPVRIDFQGSLIKEFPINTVSICFNRFVYSGGGYFRLIPYYFIKQLTKNSDYVMSYFHPRDFDPDQPIIQDLSKIRKFKSYVGLDKCHNKLDQWLKDFKFIDVRTANTIINWDNTDVIKF